jgi:hypothetical protein
MARGGDMVACVHGSRGDLVPGSKQRTRAISPESSRGDSNEGWIWSVESTALLQGRPRSYTAAST